MSFCNIAVDGKPTLKSGIYIFTVLGQLWGRDISVDGKSTLKSKIYSFTVLKTINYKSAYLNSFSLV